MQELTPAPNESRIIRDSGSNGYFIGSILMGHIDQELVDVMRVEHGDADPTILAPRYYYDAETNTVFNKEVVDSGC